MQGFLTLDIHCRFVNVLPKRLKQSSRFIIHLSSFRLNIGAKQLVVDVKDGRASKPLKSVALSDSTNVSIGWISSSSSHCFHNFPDGTLTDFKLLPQRPLTRRIRLAQLCNDFTLLGFGQASCLKFHPFPVAIHRIKGSRKRYEYQSTTPVQSVFLSRRLL